MKIQDGAYIFHLVQKGRLDKEIYIYVANKKEWDKTNEFPTDFVEADRENMEEFFEDAGLIREEDGIYRLETPIFKHELVAQLTEAGFDTQGDFSDFVEGSFSEKNSQDDEDDSDDSDINSGDYLYGSTDNDNFDTEDR